MGPNAAIESDLALASATIRRGPQVWVVLSSGLAPQREEVSFRIPAFIPEMPFIGVAFPKLVQSRFAAVEGTVQGPDGTMIKIEEICDMGSVIAHEFEAELPLITGRAIGAALTKAAASLAANLAAKSSGNEWAMLASLVATNVYGYATTIADLRTWRSLPRAWAVARVPRPADGLLRLDGAIGTHEVMIPGDADAMVLVRSIRAGGPASIHAFSLVQSQAAPVSAGPPSPSSSTGDAL